MSDSPIGLIGVGLLGSALAGRMLAGGLRVVGYDLEPAAGQRLRALGGEVAAAAADVARTCDRIVLCLPDSQVVASVIAKIGEALVRGSLIVDATTGDPEQTEIVAERMRLRGVGYIDATIAGSSEQARRGDATIIIGGLADDVRRAEPILRTWSERRFHVGPPGSGARLKLIVNLVLGLNRAVLAEGLALAAACRIDAATALNVLQATPAYSAIMDSKGPKMVAGDYAPQARLSQHLKDVRLIRALAIQHHGITPLSEVHEALLEAAVKLGYGDADNSAIIEAFRRSPS